jgi:hypothetical protein
MIPTAGLVEPNKQYIEVLLQSDIENEAEMVRAK